MALDLLNKFLNAIGISEGTSDAFTDLLGNLTPKPKKFTPSDPGYNSTTATNIKDEDVSKLMDLTRRIPQGRRVEPPSFYEYIDYPHRMDYDEYSLRIGDCCFVLPPEFISIKTTSTTDTNVTIRQENTTKTRHGYSRREIIVTMYFNGFDQINGYVVDSPMGYKYYVDGLRPLIAQFKCTPFLPIVNEFINSTHGIFNVGLGSIAVSVVPGFPDCLQATIVMQEFNVEPYIEIPGIFYDDFIDWDLFRYYYQQLMRKESGIINYLAPLSKDTDSLTGEFEFYSLDPAVLTTAKNDPKQISDTLYKDSSFTTMVSDRDSVTIDEMQFGLSNIMPSIQLSDHESPTMQYLGGADTTFNFSLSTTDRSVISKFQNMLTITQTLTRGYRDYSSIGFVKIQNELVGLTGTKFLMVDNITINSVPEYPDLFTIEIQCVSFDQSQDKKESLKGFRPFNRLGTKDDGITQDKNGLLKKIKQDNYIEKMLIENCELYPDLHLPTYSEINKVISKIIEYRQKNKLPQLQYTEYPKEASSVPGKGPNGTYSKYVDPDFYVFYPVKYADINSSIIKKYYSNTKAVASSVTIPKHDYGDEFPKGATVDSNGNIIFESDTSTSASTAVSGDVQGFIKLLTSKAGCGYVWGTDGQILTQQLLAQKKAQFGASHYTLAGKWVGKQVFDCSGFVSWGMRQVGVAPVGYRPTAEGIMRDSARVQPISKNELRPGDLCGSSTHIAVCIGDNQTIEARGTAYGVVKYQINNRFTMYGRIKSFNSSSAAKTTSSTSPSSSSPSGKSTVASLDAVLAGALKGKGSVFVSLGAKYGVDPALMAAITMQETGRGTSHALIKQNNPAGIMDWNNNWKTVKTFGSFSEGLEFSFKNLKGIINQGKTTIEAIGNVYAPVGAANDPGGLNKYWVPNVKNFYSGMTGGPYKGGSIGSAIIKLFEWVQSGFGTKVNDQTGYLDISKFGKPIYHKARDNKTLLANSMGTNTLNTMSVDTCMFSARGRILRAFPTYLFLIVDDSGEWLNGQKLWSNYYIYKSILNISVFQEDAQPVHTASITVSNAYSNLTRAPKMVNNNGTPLNTNIAKDPDYNAFTKMWYNWTGSLLGTPKLTQDMIDIKNMIWETAAVKPGCRIHIRIGYGSNPLSLPINFNGVISDIDIGDVVTLVAQSDGAELVNGVISTKKKAKNGFMKLQSEPSDILASILRERNSIIANALNKNWGEPNKFGIEHFGLYSNEGLFGNLKGKSQYDLCKNIYIGKYKCQHYTDGAFLVDGEANINFNAYNKTPWDCAQLITQFVPEFVCQPIYHQFESRLFYGLGTWPAKYRYDFDGANVYETSKAFSQMHYIDSVNDIINNKIKVSTKELRTNIVAMYSEGGDLTSTPVLYSDKTIDWSKQKTKIVDTSISQDYLGWDWLYSHLGFAVGKAATIKVGISNLLNSWKETYKDNIDILGDSSIKPCDYVVMSDNYTSMKGICTVRKVVHSIGADTGFISSITPGLIGMSTMQNSGFTNIYKSMISWAGAIFTSSMVKSMILKSFSYAKTALTGTKTVNAIMKTGTFTKNSFTATKTLFNVIKTGKIFDDFSGSMKAIKDVYTTAEGIKITSNSRTAMSVANAALKIKDVARVGKTTLVVAGSTVFPLVGTIVGWVVGEVLFDIILGKIFDMFQYNNCVNLLPLEYKGSYFVNGIKGSKKIVPGYEDVISNSDVGEDIESEDD